MKRILSVIWAAVMLMSMTACENSPSQPPEKQAVENPVTTPENYEEPTLLFSRECQSGTFRVLNYMGICHAYGNGNILAGMWDRNGQPINPEKMLFVSGDSGKVSCWEDQEGGIFLLVANGGFGQGCFIGSDLRFVHFDGEKFTDVPSLPETAQGVEFLPKTKEPIWIENEENRRYWDTHRAVLTREGFMLCDIVTLGYLEQDLWEIGEVRLGLNRIE